MKVLLLHKTSTLAHVQPLHYFLIYSLFTHCLFFAQIAKRFNQISLSSVIAVEPASTATRQKKKENNYTCRKQLMLFLCTNNKEGGRKGTVLCNSSSRGPDRTNENQGRSNRLSPRVGVCCSNKSGVVELEIMSERDGIV